MSNEWIRAAVKITVMQDINAKPDEIDTYKFSKQPRLTADTWGGGLKGLYRQDYKRIELLLPRYPACAFCLLGGRNISKGV